MAIRFITGVPGAGKSMTAVQTLLKELRGGNREIVTNMSIFPGVAWSYIKARFGIEVDAARINVLSEDQIKHFYLHRGRGWVAPTPKEKKEGGDGRIDYSSLTNLDFPEERRDAKSLPQVLYIIEEAHVHFGSRQWADTAQSALFYLSQHRHLGDEVFFVTQHVEQVDKALRRLTQEFWRMTNYGAAFPFGVKLPDVFVLDVFTTPPSLLSKAVDTRSLRLDVEGICSCYDTAAGVGMAGGLADTTGRRKGIPIWAVGLAILALAFSVYFVSIKGGNVVAKKFVPTPIASPTNSAEVRVTNSPPLVAAAAPLVAPQVQPPRPVPFSNPNEVRVISNDSNNRVLQGPSIEATKPESVKYFIRRAGFAILGLQNGETFTVEEGRLQLFGRLAVVDGNRVFRFPQ